MHHRHVGAGIILYSYTAGAGEAGLLGHGKCVQFGAQHERGAGAVLEHAHNTAAAHAGRDVVSGLTQGLRELGCSALLVPGQFRVTVDINVDRLELRIKGIDGAQIDGCLGERAGGEGQNNTPG